MKRPLITTGLLLLFVTGAFAAEQSMLARVTVYWASGGSGSDAWTRKHVTSSGAHLRAGHCAVDPRRIPYGSKVSLPDGNLLAVDTGSAVRSRKAARRSGRSSAEREAIVIDRFFETKGQALAWARTNPQFMTVRVSSPNESSTVAAKVAETRTVAARPANSVASRSSVSRPTYVKTTTIVQSQSTVAAANVMPPRSAGLRNSISTPRTPNQNVVATSVQPQMATRVATVVNSAPRVAANTLPLAAPGADDNRSHYGRSVAYLP